jgi:hypothetical protein
MAKEYTNLFFSKGPQKFTQIGILGLKIYHLATLGARAAWPHIFATWVQRHFALSPNCRSSKCRHPVYKQHKRGHYATLT